MNKFETLEAFVDSHQAQAEELLKTIGQIPAPSHREDKRAAFIKQWLLDCGAENVHIDNAKNVIFRLAADNARETVVFMAHTDVVFDDEETLPLSVEGRKMFCPGIGDDTANLVNLLMAVKYVLNNRCRPKCNIIFIANSCEEGLGNLKGCKQIMGDYSKEISAFFSFDGYFGQCCYRAVGSCRYQITVKSIGGHSYLDFGRDNAICIMADLIRDLYAIKMPSEFKTTCNVGHIEGGTTVNSIADECSILYEFRSEGQSCMDIMRQSFEAVVEKYQQKYDITVHLLGYRAGSVAQDVQRLKAFTERNKRIITQYYNGEIDEGAYSTDANVPLSLGIPANTIGTICGGMAHTRKEWVNLDSINSGMKVVLGLVAEYLDTTVL